jgi:hypothetical protein
VSEEIKSGLLSFGDTRVTKLRTLIISAYVVKQWLPLAGGIWWAVDGTYTNWRRKAEKMASELKRRYQSGSSA